MAAFPLSSCFRRTACFPLLSGIVLPAQTQSRRGHIFQFTLYMRLRHISTLFLPLFPFFEAPQEMPVLPEKKQLFPTFRRYLFISHRASCAPCIRYFQNFTLHFRNLCHFVFLSFSGPPPAKGASFSENRSALPVSAERACAHGQPAAVITAAACIVQLIIAQYAIFRGLAFPKRVKVLQAL